MTSAYVAVKFLLNQSAAMAGNCRYETYHGIRNAIHLFAKHVSFIMPDRPRTIVSKGIK